MQTEARPPKNKSASDPRPARSRARLREAALALIDEGDWHPTVEQIARRAGVSKRTFFSLFLSREAFLEELTESQQTLLRVLLDKQFVASLGLGKELHYVPNVLIDCAVRLILTGKGKNNVAR